MSLAPSWMGTSRRNVRRNNGGFKMGRSATARTQPNLVGQPIFVGIQEKEAAESFAAAVIHLDAYTLARAAGDRHIETARLWKAGKRCPNGTSLINMGRTLREVQDWINGEIDSRKPHIPVDPRSGAAAIVLLQQEAHEPGERGAMARAMLAKLSGGIR